MMAAKTLLLIFCVTLGAMNSINASSKYSYIALLQSLNFFEAWQDCNTFGGHFASIESPDDQILVERAINKTRNPKGVFYIGGTDIGHEDRWMWIGLNKPIKARDYRNFHSDVPKHPDGGQNCLTIGKWSGPAQGKWDEQKCSSNADGYVCAFAVAKKP